MEYVTWLLEAPQFWLGISACAAVVLAVVVATRGRERRTVKVYRIYDRTPAPEYPPPCAPRKRAANPPDMLEIAFRRAEKEEAMVKAFRQELEGTDPGTFRVG